MVTQFSTYVLELWGHPVNGTPLPLSTAPGSEQFEKTTNGWHIEAADLILFQIEAGWSLGFYVLVRGFLGSSVGKESACSAGDPGLIPGSGRSPGEGNGYPLQYSCLEKSHGQRSLVGCSPWDHKQLGTTEQLTLLGRFVNTERICVA